MAHVHRKITHQIRQAMQKPKRKKEKKKKTKVIDHMFPRSHLRKKID
jgi:hypothetical protein